MNKTILRRIIIDKSKLSGLSERPASDMETIGGTPLDPLRKRQSFSEALKESIAQNRGALRKLARR